MFVQQRAASGADLIAFFDDAGASPARTRLKGYWPNNSEFFAIFGVWEPCRVSIFRCLHSELEALARRIDSNLSGNSGAACREYARANRAANGSEQGGSE